MRCRRCVVRHGGGAYRADLGGSSNNSSETAKTEEEKGFLTMDNSEERAGSKQRYGHPREREAGNGSCAKYLSGNARVVLTGSEACSRVTISVE